MRIDLKELKIDNLFTKTKDVVNLEIFKNKKKDNRYGYSVRCTLVSYNHKLS